MAATEVKEVYPGEFYTNDDGDLVKIMLDDDCSYCNPREWDNLGTFVGFDRRYISPDGKRSILSILDEADVLTTDDWDVWYGYEDGDLPAWKQSMMGEAYEDRAYVPIAVRELRKKGYAALPVTVFDHGQRVYRVGSPLQFVDGRWDAGYFGIIFASPESAEQCFGELTEGWVERADEIFAQEVRTYSDWADGNVLGYVTYDRLGNEIDSCWGHIGNDAESIAFNCGGLHECDFTGVDEFVEAHANDPDVMVARYNETLDEIASLKELARKQRNELEAIGVEA